MRILHVLPQFSLELGDLWHNVHQSIKHLTARGHDVLLVGADGPDAQALANEMPCQHLAFQSQRTERDLFYTPLMIDWARQNVAAFDLIHLHGVRSFQNNLFRHYALQNNVPYIVTPHGSLDQTRLNTWRVITPEKQINLKTLASASTVLAASKLEKQELMDTDIPEDRLKLLPPGIEISPADAQAIQTYRQERGWTDPHPVALYLGRSEPKAGIHHLLRAYQRLQARIPELKLLVRIQNAEEIGDWQRRAKLLEVDREVTFCGPLSLEERTLALSAADVVMATDRNPGVELAPLEALLVGTPVVVSKASGVGELLQPSNGAYFFPASDVEVLAVGLLQALTEERNTKERQVRGRAFVQANLNWNDIADRLEQIYVETLHLHLDPAALKMSETVNN